jgi:hypothetical protein
VIAGLSGGGYTIKHNADLRAQERAVQEQAQATKRARIARQQREYQDALVTWRADTARWNDEQTIFDDCEAATLGAFAAADAVGGRIASGGSHQEYQDELTSLVTSVSSAARKVDNDLACLMVLSPLEKAGSDLSKGLNTWLDWVQGTAYQDVTRVDDLPGLNTRFGRTVDNIDDAEAALSALEPVDDAPKKPAYGPKSVSTSSDEA